ncbi:acyltransferase [Hamiltosporidium tvaerminnensis]|uniref:Acyltransferase n=2 Tax=Hamiltosporidium TaxID=1176354 RepID=A0A4Q9LN85_9MICR|nr:acyltransferase [Hamiltosporidium tvaerminnensis]TBU09416.1 acyltransferase [Hamiltosporidium magnivora]
MILMCTMKIEYEIEDLEDVMNYENCIVVSNHIGAFDFLLINEVARKKKMLKNVKFIIKKSMKWVPIFGWGLICLNFVFVERNFLKDKLNILKWTKNVKKNKIPFWIVIYPEGSRFTDAVKNHSDKFCIENGIEPLKNVIYPKTKGFNLICNELRNYVDTIIDLTVEYSESGNKNVPTLSTVLFGRTNGTVRIKSKVCKIKDIENYDQFIVERFRKKDLIISKWKNEK